TPVEQGFNTEAAKPQIINSADTSVDNKGGSFSPKVQLSSVPIIASTASGTLTTYYEFVLDANQSSSTPNISLDELRIYVTTSATPNPTALDTYDGTSHRLKDSLTPSFSGLLPVYDLDNPTGPSGDVDNYVRINTNFDPGSGRPDMFLDVPTSLFGTDRTQYVYFYTNFGVH